MSTDVRSEVQDQVGLLEPRLPDEFSRLLLSGALRVLHDRENPVRLNLFAAGVRELFTYVLDLYAPRTEVEECEWYRPGKPMKELPEAPTRRERGRYMVGGGLPDDALSNLGVALDAAIAELIDVFDTLSALTHVRPGKLINDEDEVWRVAAELVCALNATLDAVTHCRDAVTDAIEQAALHWAFGQFIRTTIQELDELSTHTLIDGVHIHDITVVMIDASAVRYEVEGVVDVTLNYGSGSDSESGLGASSGGSYPFCATMSAPVDAIQAFQDGRIEVDNSSFYE